jgi:hypothetical protein
LAFGFKFKGQESVVFDLDSQKLFNDTSTKNLFPAVVQGLDVKNWENHYSLSLKGKALQKNPSDFSRAIAFASDRSSFVLGTEFALYWYDTLGALQYNLPAPSVVWALTISSDGKYLIAGFGDGTLRWYDYQSHKEKLSLFVHSKSREWVLWTPEGFFAASPDGYGLIGYQVNHGWDSIPEIISVGQLYDAFYRPDMVLAKFHGNEAAITPVLAEVGDICKVLQNTPPPRMEIAGDVADSVDGTHISVPLRIIDRGGGIGQIEVRVNGALQQPKAYSDKSMGKTTIPLLIPAGQQSTITFTAKGKAQSGKGPVKSWPLTLHITSTAAVDSSKHMLYGLAIGVGNYRDQSMAFDAPANDVHELRKTLQKFSQPLFREIRIDTLIDGNATRANIISAFRRIPNDVKPDDVFLLYLSGHGVAMDGKFHFLPQDFIFSGPQALRDSSITSDMLVSLMSSIKARKLLFIIDACYAGALSKDIRKLLFEESKGIEQKTAIARLMQASGRAVLYASSEKQIALSGYQNGSLYTKIVIDGLRGGAVDFENNVTVGGLAEYLNKEVPRISLEKFGVAVIPMIDVQMKGSFPLTYIRK